MNVLTVPPKGFPPSLFFNAPYGKYMINKKKKEGAPPRPPVTTTPEEAIETRSPGGAKFRQVGSST